MGGSGASLGKVVTKSVEDTVKDVIEQQKYSYFQNTSMILEVIAEELFYKHGIDARYHGRTIYVGDKKVATVQTYKDGKDLVAIDKYRIIKEKSK